MGRILLVLSFLMVFASPVFSEVRAVYVSKMEAAGVKIKLGAETDTVCIVNDFYDVYNETLNLKLDFSEADHGAQGLKWTDDESVWQPIQASMTHTYPRGMHKLWILGEDGRERLYLVFNKKLTADFDFLPNPFMHCIERTDSLLLFKRNFDDNIPGTRYEVWFEPMPEDNGPFCEADKWFGPNQDSIWIKFNYGTGVKECQVYLKMVYEDTENNITIERKTLTRKSISVYQSPDVKKIFGFKEPEQGTEIKHEEVCTGESPQSVRFNVDTLGYYQYQLGLNNYPYYNTPGDKQWMDIRYFYTDSIWDEMPEDRWQDVTGTAMVSGDTEIKFMESGYYKMMITAHNQCNEFREDKTIDTLWTDRISWDENARRYFQVYTNNADTIKCLDTLICRRRDKRDTVVLVDYNRRRHYEAPPAYTVSLGGMEVTPVVEIWRNGRILAKTEEQVGGCDSTVIRMPIPGDMYGEQSLELARGREEHCGTTSKTFNIRVGNIPKVDRLELIRDLINRHGGVPHEYEIDHCDTFRYRLPVDLLTQPDWLRGLDIDSIRFCITQGTAGEDTLLYRPDSDESGLAYWLDSTEVTSYVRIRSFNACGWNEGELKLNMFARPEFNLLRDSLPENDSLCIHLDYPYYLGGKQPKAYTITMTSLDRPVFVNGVRTDVGTSVGIREGDGIRYEQAGDNYREQFEIKNDKMPSCKVVATVPLVSLEMPDTLVYPDSVSYCEGLTTLQTVKLFAEGKSDFKWGTWKLNNEAEVKESLPEIAMTGGVDTLRYRLSRSKGCYVQGEVLLRPQEAPKLKLRDEARYCLPQEKLVFRKDPEMLESELLWNGHDSLTVYYDEISSTKVKYYDGRNHVNDLRYSLEAKDNGHRFIYDLVNRRVDTAFMGKCRVVDTVKLRVSSPKVNILKADTLKYPWGTYDFSRLKDKGFVDTAQVDATTLQWTLRPEGTPCGTSGRLYAGSYTLTSADQAKDTLLFELSAKDYCGKEWKDTLRVELVKLVAEGYKDIICSNREDYPLWDKVKASHVDLDAVEWKIMSPTGSLGTLSGTTGSGVTYTPAGDTRSVTIQFTAALENVPMETVSQEIVLTVNPAPVFKITKDTLWACGKRVDLAGIPYFQTNEGVQTNSKGKKEIVRGDWVSVPGEGSVGTWSGDNYTFEDIILENFDADLFQKVSYKAKALPGCKDVLDTVVLAQPVPAAVKFKRSSEDMCAGDTIRLDTLYDLRGKDAFVKYDWQLGNKAAGHFWDNFRYYVASWPQDEIQALKVTTYKEYTCYTGNSSGMVLRSNEITLPLTVHRQPEFRVVHKRDTLCNNQTEIDILRDWVSVDRSVYPDYQDSVKINGLPFRGDGFHPWTVNDIGEQKLVVTVSQGRCTKWKDKRDTIYLYRLEQMSNGLFSVPNVCEGGEKVEINKSQLVNSPLARQRAWSATGGQLSDNDRYFVPDEHVSQGTVTLTVTPPHGCPAESYTSPVQIGKRPQLKNTAYTVCALTGHTQDIYTELTDPAVQVQSIEWMRSDAPDNVIAVTNATDPSWSFTVTDADLQRPGGVELIARIKSVGVCQGTFENTVRLTWQKPQEYAVRQMPEICQADPMGIDLRTMVDVMYSGPLVWSMNGTDLGALEGSLFKPADQSGTANVVVTLPGLNGCPERVETLPVTVKPAPLSDIKLEGEPCTGREVKLRPENARAQRYDWEFGDGGRVSGSGAAPVKHTYANPGDYTIKMTSHFANGCTREETKPWTVNPTPEALFTLPDPAPIAKPVDLVSLSQPETVTCLWTVDDATSYNGQSVSHTFSNAGGHTVRLVVTAPEGCTDTLVNRTTVLDVPVARFKVEVDSCAGKVRITNLSTRNGATVAWDFGNGESVSSSWDPAEKSYPLVYRDTTYTIRLTLANVSDTVEDTKSFKMISKLQPGFELWEVGPCNKTEKEIHIQTRGKADTTVVDWGDGSVPDRWSLSDNPISVLRHRYPLNASTAALSYTIRLRTRNACYNLDWEKEVSILPQQVRAKFVEATDEYPDHCFGDERGFWNKSFGFSRRDYTCEWNFGDGSATVTDTVTVTPTVHTFEKPGDYMVRLRVKDECDELMDSLQIRVLGNDSLDFAFSKDKDRLCTGDTLRIWLVERGSSPFTDLKWSLPGGAELRDQDTILYICDQARNGASVRLRAVADGCPETAISKLIVVQQTPDPIIAFARPDVETVGCTPLKLPFRAINGNGGTEGLDIFWDFGDGSTSIEGEPPLKVYEQSGEYTVQLRMASSFGCMAWDALPVTAKVTPKAELELDRHLVCSREGDFEIWAKNRTAASEDCSFEWLKGGVVYSMSPDSIRIPFTGFHGKEEIALRVVNNETRCADMARDTVVAALPVKAGLQVMPDTVCAGMEVKFRDTVSWTVAGRLLSFEDGSESDSPETERNYWEPGKYAYLFAVRSVEGCTDTIRDTVYVHSLPEVDFDWQRDNTLPGVGIEVDPKIENGGIRFTNLSLLEPLPWEEDGLRFRWLFGDGETANDKDPAHRYANNGSYEVWLHAITPMGCRDSVSQVLTIDAMTGLYFPNAMIPGSDDPAVNRFQPRGIGLMTYQIKVYAPGGTCVWMSDKLEDGQPAEYWDGTFNGQPVTAGVYLWEASALFIDGTVRNHLNGSLIVIR